jgi:hypothetical protein
MTVLYDPTVDDLQGREATQAPRLSDLQGKTIGLLTDGKVNADVLLHETARLLEERHGCRVVLEEDKGNSSRPAPPEMLQRIAAVDVDFMVTAVGD